MTRIGICGASESREWNIRTDSRTSKTEADSNNWQVRKSEIELYMADTLPDGIDNVEWGCN